MKDIQFVIVTGMSGAGKTLALKIFEDRGFFCIDNLPPAFLSKLFELCLQGAGQLDKLAVVSDIRGGEFFDTLSKELQNMEDRGFRVQTLFLEAADEVLVRRYKESRRRHPLAPEGRILEGIARERKKLEELRGIAHRVIDTSEMTRERFEQVLQKYFFSGEKKKKMSVTIISFGYKHGLPVDADLVMDVRFLPNPHYVPSLQPFSGQDPEVQQYVNKWPVTRQFREKFFRLVLFLLPHYINEGKSHLTIALGCTGGRHRSVVLGEKLASYLTEKGYSVRLEHRDQMKAKV